MRLSTAKDRDDARALSVLAAALDAGVELLDTADSYAHDERDVGHNERLIAHALAHAAEARAGRGDANAPDRRSDAKRPLVVTKGGLTRPDGAWIPNGRARHLEAAARASRDRLGEIDLYLLHAVDPKVPLATSVRALARLREQGIVRGIGLSNIGLHQLEQALAITAPLFPDSPTGGIDAVQIELSPWHLDAIRGGLLAACKQRGIRVLAHRPFGGAAGVKRIARDELLAEIAAKHAPGATSHAGEKAAVTPYEIVLAWLRRFGVVPLPGATRIETARSATRHIVLDAESANRLDAHFVSIAERPISTGARAADAERPISMGARAADAERPTSTDARVGDGEREVVIIMGMPASGKTTLALDYAARGYLRLNRDERGGTLLQLARTLDRELAAGATRVVLDNTYATRALRAQVIEVAKRHDVPVRCLVAATSVEQAQANAVSRMLELHGRLLEPAELRKTEMIAPNAQFRYRREYEPPRLDEGFAALEEIAFVARTASGPSPSATPHAVSGPRPSATPHAISAALRPALFVELDDLVWRGRPANADAIVVEPAVALALRGWSDAGYFLAGTSWLTTAALDERLAEVLERPIVVGRCAHPAGPPICWCRKPLPGLALWLARQHGLDLARSVHIGNGAADRGFAARAGLRYVDAADGFPLPDGVAMPANSAS